MAVNIATVFAYGFIAFLLVPVALIILFIVLSFFLPAFLFPEFLHGAHARFYRRIPFMNRTGDGGSSGGNIGHHSTGGGGSIGHHSSGGGGGHKGGGKH